MPKYIGSGFPNRLITNVHTNRLYSGLDRVFDSVSDCL